MKIAKIISKKTDTNTIQSGTNEFTTISTTVTVIDRDTIIEVNADNLLSVLKQLNTIGYVMIK